MHQRAHELHRAVEPAEDRLADEEMADIELDDGADRRDRADRVEGQAVAGVAFEAERLGPGRRRGEAPQLALARLARGVAIGAGMELDDGRAEALRGLAPLASARA